MLELSVGLVLCVVIGASQKLSCPNGQVSTAVTLLKFVLPWLKHVRAFGVSFATFLNGRSCALSSLGCVWCLHVL